MNYSEPLEGVVGGGTEAQSVIDFVVQNTPHDTAIPNVHLYSNGAVADLRSYTDPTRQRAIREAHDVASFVAMIEHDGDGDTVEFYSRKGSVFCSVIDYGTEAKPTRDEHRIVFRPEPDPEWGAWASIHGKPIAQADFADFVEEHMTSVVTPEAADLLELIQDVRGHKNVSWQAGQRLQDGTQRLEWTEEQTARSGKGQTDVPSEITIRTPIFRGEDPVTFDAWLRYRIADGGKLTFTVKLKRPNDIVPEALDAIAAKIGGGTGQPILAGWPE